MRKINIVGAGQSGLQLAIGLLKNGYDVTVYSDRTPEQIYHGSVMSTQCMFDSSLQTERDLGLNLWDDECPAIEGLGVTIAGPDGQKALSWQAPLDQTAQSPNRSING
jgi:2-polyprenyl-6-methoxyphenol hydroxylase-like FAD-dependent oxidoreductase